MGRDRKKVEAKSPTEIHEKGQEPVSES